MMWLLGNTNYLIIYWIIGGMCEYGAWSIIHGFDCYFSYFGKSFSLEERGHVIAAFLCLSTWCPVGPTELKAGLRSSECVCRCMYLYGWMCECVLLCGCASMYAQFVFWANGWNGSIKKSSPVTDKRRKSITEALEFFVAADPNKLKTD